MRAPVQQLSLVAAVFLLPADWLGADSRPSRPGAGSFVTPTVHVSGQAERGPKVSDRVSSWLSGRLVSALELAAEHIRNYPSCQALFADRGEEGVETLLASSYHPATQQDERISCGSSAALTTIGGRVTQLCHAFASLSQTQAAVILVHEALHHAGMTEYPSDPEGMTSVEISWLVKKRCAL